MDIEEKTSWPDSGDDHVQRADPHCDWFSSQHAEPWKAVRSKDGCFQHVRNAQVDRGEGDQEDTPEDGSNDVSIHRKQLDDTEVMQQGDTV